MRRVFIFLIVVLSLVVNQKVAAQKKSGIPTLRDSKVASVVLDRAGAFSEGKGVWLDWTTSVERENLGFYVYRETPGATRERVNNSLIAGMAISGGPKFTDGRRYTFFDPRGNLSSRYVVEQIGTDGSLNVLATISTVFVADLTTIAGASSKQLRNNALRSKNEFSAQDLILPDDLKQEVSLHANSSDLADPVNQRWVAAQPGVKIGVKQDGLYRVTRTQLQAAGFNVNSPTANWQLYVDGEEQAILVEPTGAYIEFFGRGIDIQETDTRIYFLVAGANPGRRMQSVVRRRLSADVAANSFQQSIKREDRYTYASGILNGDADNYFGGVITSSGLDQPINVPNLDPASPQSSLDVSLMGLTQVVHQVRVLVNGTVVGTLDFAYNQPVQAHFDIPTSLLVSGNNNVRFVSTVPSGDLSFVDFFTIGYPRSYVSAQDRLAFYTQNYRTTRIGGFSTSDVRVFDLTDSKNPTIVSNALVQQDGATFTAMLPPHRSRVMYASAGSGLLSPDSIALNTPSTWSTSAHSANLVIISFGGFMNEANQWATMRRSDPMNVEVINVEDIFDEFGYGLPTADSIRNFLSYAISNWQQAPQYALLIGDATYDPRNYGGNGFNNLVPTPLVDTSFIQTGSDEALADFDLDGLSDIAIGRIPARTAQRVTLALNKTVAFESTRNVAQQRGFYCVSDGPIGFDFEALCNRMGDLVPAGIPKMFLNQTTVDSRTQLLSTFNSGKYLVNYSGHGNHAVWSGNSFYTTNDALGHSNTNLSIVVSLSCLNAYYVEYNDGLAEGQLFSPNGGGVAVWASSGLTTPDVQEVMATRFYQQLYGTTLNRLGDIVRDAKTTIPGGRDVRLSWAIIGDPSLRVR